MLLGSTMRRNGRSVSAMEERITAAMKDLGFTANAARVYLALLKHHPATGYELASSSGVPRSAIYNLLATLEGQGFVSALQGKPARYIPLPPETLCRLLKARLTRGIEELEESLSRLDDLEPPAPTWTVQGYSEMLDHAVGLIANAEHSIYASLWRREAGALAGPLKKAQEAGVPVVLHSFTKLPEGLGVQLSYGIAEDRLEEYWSHRIILLVDNHRVLVGGAEKGDRNRVVVTEEEALVDMARSNLVLDITLYGERSGTDTSDVVTKLTAHLAPIEELVAEQG